MLEHKIHKLCISHHLTLALAESCTGGALAAKLTALPDSSLYFLGSIVAYANEAKKKLLSVSNSILSTYGAVSEQTATQMAQGAGAAFGADIALSVTGIAGPSGGSLEKPVGTVCFSISFRKEIKRTWRAQFQGNRQEIILQSIEEALSSILEEIGSAL